LAELNRVDLNNNPFIQFEIWLNKAYEVAVKEPNAMCLATVNSNGQPSARMVLLRGFSEDGFVFYTNYLSKKGKTISTNNKAALLFFWDDLQQQIRIEGSCEKVSNEQSNSYFQSRPFESRVASSISPQSEIIKNRNFLQDKFDKTHSEATRKSEIERPQHWGGYILKPYLYEFWQGRKSRLHDRFQYTKTGNSEWLIERLAP